MKESARIVDIFIKNDEDVILARQNVRTVAVEMGFSLLDQTRLVTAVSELARNIVVHAKEGKVMVFKVAAGEDKKGIKVVFEDHGPGIMDIKKALQEGFSTVGSMGLGLKGARRLVDEFDLQSAPGQGTMVTIIKYLG